MTCPECRFFQSVPKREDVGECRRMPPSVMIVKFRLQTVQQQKVRLADRELIAGGDGLEGATAWQSVFPLVNTTWVCGEFTPKMVQ